MKKMFLKVASKISKFLGKIHSPGSRKKIKSLDYRDCKLVMKKGMVFVTLTKGEFANLFIPGFFSHAAEVADMNTVVEAVTHGVQTNDLIDFLLTKDYAVLLRPKFLTEEQMEKSADWALLQKGKGYDYEFSSDTEQFYCSELIFSSYKNNTENFPLTLKNRLSQLTYVPHDFWEDSDNFEIVWMSNSMKEEIKNNL